MLVWNDNRRKRAHGKLTSILLHGYGTALVVMPRLKNDKTASQYPYSKVKEATVDILCNGLSKNSARYVRCELNNHYNTSKSKFSTGFKERLSFIRDEKNKTVANYIKSKLSFFTLATVL